MKKMKKQQIKINQETNIGERRSTWKVKKILEPQLFDKEKYTAVALYSGGVDSTLAALLAREQLKVDVLLLMVSLGESQNNIEQAKERANILGMDLVVLDGTSEFARDYISEAIRMNGSYWGYPLITPLSRAYMVKKAFEFISTTTTKSRYLIHGCNVFQNTRFRIEKHCSSEGSVIAVGPLASRVINRAEKIRILAQHGIKVNPGSEIAEDDNLWGRALEGEPLNDLEDIHKKNVFKIVRDLKDTPDAAQVLSISFEHGLPVALNGKRLELSEIIMRCREFGAAHGIGRIVIFEDTIPELGYKQRGVFESPASRILYAAHEYIEAVVFSKLERELKRDLDQKWAEIVYRGGWYDSNRLEISEFIAPLEAKVNGDVSLELFKGNVTILEANIPQMSPLGGTKGAY